MICLAHLNFEAMKVPFLFALVSITTAMMAQPNLTPGAPQSERILVLGGTAHLGTGEAIENAAIGFEDGIIDFVGAARDVDPKRYARVVSAEGMHIYPGFIAPNSTLGLMEVAAVRNVLRGLAAEHGLELGPLREGLEQLEIGRAHV